MCVGKELLRLWENDLKRICAMDRMLGEREGEEGMGMHKRKLVLATKGRGLCGCKRLTKTII